MSTSLLTKIYSESLHSNLYLDPAVLVIDHCHRPGDKVQGTIGEALGFAVLQKGLEESVHKNAQRFDQELDWLAHQGNLWGFEACIVNAFAANGIAVTREPSLADTALADRHLKLVA